MRRCGLPIAAFVLAVAFLVARLYDVQVTQHDTWAREAANLVRSYHVEPYTRGTIRDRNGHVIARDEQVYQLELVWRDFRRGHPLGQVAMALSTIGGAPVTLEDTHRALQERALELVSLTPRAVGEFGRGAPLALGGRVLIGDAAQELHAHVDVADTADDAASTSDAAQRTQRRARAGDVEFYVARLLALTDREERAVRRLVEDAGLVDKSFAELASIATGVGSEQLRADLTARLAESRRHLGRLARELQWTTAEAPAGVDPAWFDTLAAEAKLLLVLEARRVDVEDDTADALFSIALGCPPWRFDQANLGRLDLGWIERLLGWGTERRLEWIRRRGAEWPEMVDDWVAGHVIARAKLARRDGDLDPAHALLAALAHAFRTDAEAHSRKHGVPEDWRRVDDLEGLASLPAVLQRGAEVTTADLTAVLPLQDPGLRRSRASGEDLLLEVLGPRLDALRPLVEEAWAAAPVKRNAGRSATRTDAARRLVELVDSSREDWDSLDRLAVGTLLEQLEVDLQRRLTELFTRLDPTGTVGAIRVRPEAVARAEETRRYVVRDRGSRAKVIGREPSYELVHLVTRHPREFAGFHVRPTTRRTRPHEAANGWNYHEDDVRVAAFLVGEVRHPYLVDLLRQRPSEVELAEMQRKLALPKADREDILGLVEAAWHPGERMGGSGLEGWLDPELRGSEGYSEFQGLQDRKSGNRAPIHVPAVDGRDVWLTLDLELQRATEALLRAPTVPAGDSLTDVEWFEHPVGAIVLATVEGELLVAASTPLVPGQEPGRDTDGERRNALDRTLRRPKGEPPGSILKPLFSAYALQNLGVRFEDGLVVCGAGIERLGAEAKPTTHAGWGKIDCYSSQGHSATFGQRNVHRITMREALVASCNTYFAALGERHYDAPHMRTALELFGLGQPTGVRFDPEGRSGFVENSAFGDNRSFPPGGGPTEPWMRQFVTNGLAYINVNVVQMARAFAGLATGELPTMRLVRRIGDVDTEVQRVRIPIDEAHFERVRDALRSVVKESVGSGFGKGLAYEDLGFELAGKTGSADYRRIPKGESDITARMEDDYMRKHAWFAGYFPCDAPRYVVIVYVHDTAATASHIATHVASQFLRLPEIQAFLARERAQ
jgi:cell division protein FtsI/penicillin-binding protein 2